jgi:hypothetical protein
MSKNTSKAFRLNIGHVVKVDGEPESRVVGVDHYQIQPIDNASHGWESYTLVANDNSKKRWWITVSSKLGISVWNPIPTLHAYNAAYNAVKNPEKIASMCGIAHTKIEGDAIQQSSLCALDLVRLPSGEMLSTEVFYGGQTLLFRGRLIRPQQITKVRHKRGASPQI